LGYSNATAGLWWPYTIRPSLNLAAGLDSIHLKKVVVSEAMTKHCFIRFTIG